MRMDQYVGLNKWARDLLASFIIKDVKEEYARTYPNGRVEVGDRVVEVDPVAKETYAKEEGAFTPEFLHLQKYTLPDGRVLYEVVQTAPWSGGPCYFLALSEGGSTSPMIPESMWTDGEMEEYL